MVVNNTGFPSIEQLTDQLGTQAVQKQEVRTPKGQSFEEVLSKVTHREEPVKFSKHAMNRLTSRGIDLTTEQVERLNEGKVRASEKGIKESLIMVDDFKFIVNVPNNTVVTALDGGESSEKVFTNIDGAVII